MSYAKIYQSIFSHSVVVLLQAFDSGSANQSYLRKLYILRFIAIAGQIAAVFVVFFQLQIQIPLTAVTSITLLLLFFNVYAGVRISKEKKVSDDEIFIHLLVDVIALAGVLFFTGGATNPFIILFLFPLTIAVTILPAKYSWLLATITVACYSLLMVKYQALPVEHSMMGHDQHREYNLHIIGMWLGFIVSAGLVTHYVFGMGSTLRKQQKLLAEAREQALRDEQLLALGTLAASTAHELGTPLGTMSLLVSEIKEELRDAPESVILDLELLKQQIGRCKNALTELSASANGSPLQGGQAMPVFDYLQGLHSQLTQKHLAVNVKCHWGKNNPEVMILADRSLDQALDNILTNAIQAAAQSVDWRAEWSNQELRMQICDDGPGLSPEAEAIFGKQPFSEKRDGLGLGVYLTHAIIQRFGGVITRSQRDGGGTCISVILPLMKL